MSSNSEGIEKQERIHVYILQLSNRTYYTGITNDLIRRMKEHADGQSKSTKRHLPVNMIFSVRMTGRHTARNLEVQIKKKGAKRWLNQLRFSKFRFEYDIEKEPDTWDTKLR